MARVIARVRVCVRVCVCACVTAPLQSLDPVKIKKKDLKKIYEDTSDGHSVNIFLRAMLKNILKAYMNEYKKVLFQKLFGA